MDVVTEPRMPRSATATERFEPMKRLGDDELVRLDESVTRALETGDETELDVLGYGEISTVLGVDTPNGGYACKRLPPFRSSNHVDAYMQIVERYMRELGAGGVHAIETDLRTVPKDDGQIVVYLVQPKLPSRTLGPSHFERLGVDRAPEAFARILDLIRATVKPHVAPDGQLSNWAFVGDDIVYIDVTTPFMRDENGQPLMDWTPFIEAVPPIVRPLMRRGVPKILASYHSLRGQVVDFLANLRKHGLDDLVPALLDCANELLAFERPITVEQVRKYYRVDARTYALLEKMRRVERWRQQKLLGRTYPILLPPRIERGL